MLLIKGGRLIDPKSKIDGLWDLIIDGGRVVFILPGTEAAHGAAELGGIHFEEIINARGKIIIPGLVDIHVHFRDPGLTYKEDIESGSAAAARGGYTTVVCMANTKPPVDNPETLREVLDKAASSPIHVHTLAALTRGLAGAELNDLAVLKETGALGFSDDGMAVKNPRLLKEAMLKCRDLDMPLSLHEEDPAMIDNAGVNAGEAAAALGLKGAPAESESSMVERDCGLALETGAKVHIQHVSSALSLKPIEDAKNAGGLVSAEVTPQHLALTEKAVLSQGTLAKINPPLRTEADRRALIAALKNGIIDCIATDHAPHSPEEKKRPFTEAPSGVIGLETALALCISGLVKTGQLDLMTLVEKMSLAPAKRYGLDAGYLGEGSPADLAVVDQNQEWLVSGFYSRSSNSPFIGESVSGKVLLTMCRGSVVFRDSSFPPQGSAVHG